MPYDAFCPSVQTKLHTRICTCGKYFSSMASLKCHRKLKKNCEAFTPPITPCKILGQRTGEKLVLLDYDKEQDVEWIDDSDIILDGNIFVEPEPPENKIYDIQTVLNPIWDEVQT